MPTQPYFYFTVACYANTTIQYMGAFIKNVIAYSLNYFFFFNNCSLLLADLEVAYNTLLVSAHSPVTVDLATDNPFSSSELSILEAKTIAMFNLNAFMDIGSAKSSIIGVSFWIDSHRFP